MSSVYTIYLFILKYINAWDAIFWVGENKIKQVDTVWQKADHIIDICSVI